MQMVCVASVVVLVFTVTSFVKEICQMYQQVSNRASSTYDVMLQCCNSESAKDTAKVG